jgi:predicted nuclease of restriction endonuclease-like (RecB) superfamily
MTHLLPAGYAAWLADLKARIRGTRLRAALAAARPDPAILQQVVGKLPWGQNIALLAVKNPAARLWYAEATPEHGWSRPVRATQIDTKAHARQGKAPTNFAWVLPPGTCDLASRCWPPPCRRNWPRRFARRRRSRPACCPTPAATMREGRCPSAARRLCPRRTAGASGRGLLRSSALGMGVHLFRWP